MIKALALLFERQPSTPSVLPPPRVPPKKISFKWAEHERLLRPSLRPPRPPVWLEHGERFRSLNFLDSVVRTSRRARIWLGGAARGRAIFAWNCCLWLPFQFRDSCWVSLVCLH